jgi:hypothetical protein
MEPITPGSETPPMMEQEPMGEDAGTPLDAIIGQVDAYIANPGSATPETLTQLKNDLMDLKAGIEGEEPEMGPPPPAEGSFSGDIQKRMSGGAF